MVRLIFVDKQFTESAEKKDGEAVLELNKSDKTAELSFSPDANLIARRTAQRQASSICKTGFLLKNGSRIGVNFDLRVEDENSIDERLLQEGHKYR